MVVRTVAAPPTSWSTNLAEPTIHETAQVHSGSTVVGDVQIGPNAFIAPGASIRAEGGSPFFIGEGVYLQEGVAIHGLQQGKVLGDNQAAYSVWIGDNSCLTHKVLIQGPAYVGEDCFIGFRSTIFNARVGKGCIVMMHALIQDVEIPPGKYVPSGSVITTQKQVDRLPNVQPQDWLLVRHIQGSPVAQSRSDRAATSTPTSSLRSSSAPSSRPSGVSSSTSHSEPLASMQLSVETVHQVRQLLHQGYRIGTEHADPRRFQINSWQSCAPISSTRESEVLSALESCLAEHQGEYVRLLGIDPQAKRRVLETVIYRPGSGNHTAPASSLRSPASQNNGNRNFSSGSSGSSNSSSQGQGGLDAEVVGQVRQLLHQGYRIGTEHADPRRFQINSWQSCAPITSTRESDVLAGLEACLAEHQGDYVRLIGIDPHAKRRVLETVIQRPGSSRPVTSSTSRSTSSAAPAPRSTGSFGGSATATAPLTSEVVGQIRQLLAQGCRISAEYADARRFQINSWNSCASISSNRESDVFSTLEACIAEHPGDYVRVIGIDPKAKRRVAEVVIQRPRGK